jgi:O-acetyl-ADP-ribose deacetylase (regulator of RNase III)
MAVPTQLEVWQGEIAELEVDALIVPANETLFMTIPVTRAVKRRSGEAIERAAVEQGPIEAGSAVVTGGGDLAAPYVIHAVAVGHDLQPDAERVRRALNAALEIAARLGLHRLAMAPIGIDRGVFTAEEAAGLLAGVLAERSTSGNSLPSSLVVATAGPTEAAAYHAALEPLRAVPR